MYKILISNNNEFILIIKNVRQKDHAAIYTAAVAINQNDEKHFCIKDFVQETMLGRLMCGSTGDVFANGSFTFLTRLSLKIIMQVGG